VQAAPKVRIHCFTSFTFSSLAEARVLAATLKKRHPDWYLWAVISDREPGGFAFKVADELFDDVIWSDELFGDLATAWLFQHDLSELCAAAKGRALSYIAESTDADRIFYFDPAVAILNSLQPLVDSLETASLLGTPDQVEAENNRVGALGNEFGSLGFEAYSRTFVARRSGVFTPRPIPIKDAGWIVASWNLNQRQVRIDRSGEILADGSVLRIFNFDRIGPTADIAIQRCAKHNLDAYEIWSWHKRQVQRYTDPTIPLGWWKYAQYSNGSQITKAARELYRNREDLRRAFLNPFDADGKSYYAWLEKEHRRFPSKDLLD
jgi:hypothetical protein